LIIEERKKKVPTIHPNLCARSKVITKSIFLALPGFHVRNNNKKTFFAIKIHQELQHME